MIYLLDTNVISESIKKKPNKAVMAWLDGIELHNCSISVISLGEIRKGIEMLINGKKKQTLIQWLEIDLTTHFYGRIISIDQEVADKWGYLCSLASLPAIDALIAASALVHNLKLVTRNIKDFNRIDGIEIINPWED